MLKVLPILIFLMIGSMATAGNVAITFSSLPRLERGLSPDSRVKRELSAEEHGVATIALERAGDSTEPDTPIYSVIFEDDGTVRYEGRSGVGRIGSRTGKMHAILFNRVAEVITKMGYADMDSNYGATNPDGGGGGETIYTSAVINGQRKIIRNQDSRGPDDLWAVEQLVDQMLSRVQWDREGTAGSVAGGVAPG